MEFYERIKSFRREKGYSQEQVARKLHITQGAVSQWEKGITTPSAQQIALLADLLDTTADDLLGREQPPQQQTLDNALISLLMALNPSQIQRVKDFVAGMLANSKE